MLRRTFVQGAAAGAIGVFGLHRAVSASDDLVVSTTAGAVRGYRDGGVAVFRGLRYGAPTSGANRFRPPRPPEAHEGVLDAFDYGERAPQTPMPRIPGFPLESWSDTTAIGEDCLRLNVWTPSLEPDARRPVMVWLHGGGFRAGSGSTNVYDGGRLAAGRDLVVVTLNHRLNVMGHLHLEDLDPSFTDSGNVGMLDIVAALTWVRDNIAAFGGDPDRVTIFGESGGGAKVAALMAMPPAAGLFHRAISQSGVLNWGVPHADAVEARAAILDQLELEPSNITALQDLPFEDLIGAMEAQIAYMRRFSPVIGGSLPDHPFINGAPAVSRDVPYIIGSTRDEATLLKASPANFTLTWEGLPGVLAIDLGGASGPVIEGYQALHPDYSPSEVYFAAMTQHMMTRNNMQVADARAEQGGAGTWVYSLEWRTPVGGGRWGSPHTLEIPMVFDTVATSPSLLPDNDETRQLTALCGDLWSSFARDGAPTSDAIDWPVYDADSKLTLAIDLPPRLEANFREEERALLGDIPWFNIGR